MQLPLFAIGVAEEHKREIFEITTLKWTDLTVVWMDDLEVLDGGLRDAPVEVEHVGLTLLVPAGRFVHQGDQVVCVPVVMTNK